ncbi:MAG: hypothetical protein HYY61_05030 [Deltaproteobacteria bacterium]|nr:hypothetical protein [Deltaproteobacteria bacterium]
MKQKVLAILLSLSFLTYPMAFAREVTPAEAQKDKIYLKSHNAKLYQALRLIDDRSNWLKVSELLREVLASDLEGRYVRDHLKLAKREIDAELPKSFVINRVLDWPFIVAKLRILEAIMANHARLNVSYDREVPLIRGLLRTYFFPGMEEECDILGLGFPSDGKKEEPQCGILVPDKSSYSFDIYGYVKENVLKTETAPSGVIEDPRFPPEPKKDLKKTSPVPPLPGGQIGKPQFLTPEEIKEQLSFLQKMLEGMKRLLGTSSSEIEDLFKVIRLQNQYEPLAMLMQLIAHPDSMYSDPQLYDFAQGVKVRLKMGEYDYRPEEQNLLTEVLRSQTDLGLTIEEDVNSTTGKAALYVTSNLTHGPAMLNIRYLIYLKKFIELYPMVSQYGPPAIEFLTFLKGLGLANTWYVKFFAWPARIAGNLVLGSGSLVTTVLKNGRMVALLSKVGNTKASKWLTQNDRYFKIALAVTMAADLTEGVIQVYSAVDKYERIEAVQRTLSETAATSLYLMPLISQKAFFRWLGWGALALDVGHRIYSDIPETHDVLYWVLSDYITDPAFLIFTGDTVKGYMVKDYEQQIGVSDEEANQTLQTFEKAIALSSKKEELAISHEAFEQTMKSYANKRLFLIYYLIQRWNNNEVEELGEMERNYWQDYQRYEKKVASTRELYQKRSQELESSVNSAEKSD